MTSSMATKPALGNDGPALSAGVRSWTIAVGITTMLQGAWAFLWPMRFYDDFPVPEAGWVSTLGPFNEHLARDFGSALAGLGVIAVLAGLSNSRTAVRGVMTGFVLFGVPHLVYHLSTFDEFSVASALTQLAALTLFVAVPAFLLTATRPSEATKGVIS